MVTQRTPKARKPKAAPKPKRSSALAPSRVPSIAARIIALGETIPEEVLATIPTDSARNLDHYLYGAPKNDD